MVTTYQIKCVRCNEKNYILARPVDIEQWMSGTSIQDALPYLTPDERELLISRMCPSCWTELFGNE